MLRAGPYEITCANLGNRTKTRDVMIIKQTIASDFYSHWVFHTSGLVLSLVK